MTKPLNPRSLVADADGPWIPLTADRRIELVRRLSQHEVSPEVRQKLRLAAPRVSRAMRSGIVSWLDEKSAGGGTDWTHDTMWRYRAVLRDLGGPEGRSDRAAGFTELAAVGLVAVAATTVAAVIGSGPSSVAALLGSVLDITLIIGVVVGIGSS